MNCSSPMMPIVNALPVMSNACLKSTASISEMPVVDSAFEARYRRTE